jgi:hypothetical protein
MLLLGGICYGADLDLSGLLQIRYTDNRDLDGTFAARTARLGAKVKVTEKISAQAQFELAREPNLLDAMIDYSFSPALNVRIGQFKLPFGHEIQLSPFGLEAGDRALIHTHLWYNGVSRPYIRDTGALVFGRYMLFDYALGAVNGAGYNYTDDPDGGGVRVFPRWGMDNNNSKDIVGRIGIGVPMFAGMGFSFYEGNWPVGYTTGTCNEDRSAKAFDIFLDTGKVLFHYERVWAQGRLLDQDVAAFEGHSAVSHALPGDRWQDSEYGGSFVVIGYRFNAMIEPVYKLDLCDPDEDADGDRLTDTYFGVNLNFEGKARLQMLYRESKVARRFVDNGFVAQVSARL